MGIDLRPRSADARGRRAGHGHIQDIARVQQAYLEPNGMISVVTRDGAQNGPAERPEAL